MISGGGAAAHSAVRGSATQILHLRWLGERVERKIPVKRMLPLVAPELYQGVCARVSFITELRGHELVAF